MTLDIAQAGFVVMLMHEAAIGISSRNQLSVRLVERFGIQMTHY